MAKKIEVQIDEKTSISLVWVFSAIPFIAGALIWLTNIDAKAERALIEAQEQKPILKETHDAVIRVEERLKRVLRH